MDNRGSIFILAVWIMALLVLLSVGLGQSLLLDQKLVGYERDRLIALYLAKAGYARAVAALERDPDPELDAAHEPLFSDPEAFQEVALGEGRYTVATHVRDGENTETVLYGLSDEDRKINLNTASREVLLRLPGVTPEIADSILDWRDDDATPQSLGAEDFYYQGLELSYESKDAPFEVLAELLLVKGVTAEVFQGLEPFVTIYTDGKVNVNTAPREVLLALGMSEQVADKVIGFRVGPDGALLTSDDQYFEQLGSLTSQLNAFASLPPQEASQLTNLIAQDLLKVNSQVFTIVAHGQMGRIVRTVEAVIKRGEAPTEPVTLLAWRAS